MQWQKGKYNQAASPVGAVYNSDGCQAIVTTGKV